MKWLAIINPSSGRRKTGSQLAQILDALKSLTREYAITSCQGDAEEIARQSTGFDGLAVVGGDGTLHEVLRGMDYARHRLAILPAGTGNSLARDLGISSIMAGVKSVREENLTRIDLMRVTCKTKDGSLVRYDAASTVALGYPAAAAKTANERLKPLGRLCYTLAAVAEAYGQRPFSVRLRYDSREWEQKSLTGALFNNTRHIAHFLTFPQASIEDGCLDTLEFNAGFLKQNMYNFSVLSKKYSCMPGPPQKLGSLKVELETPHELMVDGQIYPEIAHMQIDVISRRLMCYRSARVPW